MKRKKASLLLLAGLCLTLTGCLKDGMNDFEALRHPLHLQGTFNPTYGMPLGTAEINMENIISMFKETNGYITYENDYVTLSFDTSITSHVDINTSKKAADDRDIYDYTANGHLDIDVFKNVENYPDTGDLKIKNLYVTLNANIRAEMDEATIAMVQRTGTEIYFDSIRLNCRDKYGNQHAIVATDSHFVVHDFKYGTDIPLIAAEDIKDIINLQPDRLTYSVRVNISIPSDSVTLGLMDFLANHLGFKSLDITTHAIVNFPITAYINNLTYDLNLSMTPIEALQNLKVDTSVLLLELDNSLPFEFDLTAELQDENGTRLCDLFGNTIETLAGSVIAYDATLGNYTSARPTHTLLSIPLDQTKMQALQNCYNIHITSTLRTSRNMDNPPAKPEVTVGRHDKLSAKAYARLSPIVEVDIPLTHSK